jgi:hypothetical protein
MPDTSWSSKAAERFDHRDFLIAWQAKRVVCPAGQTSRDWGHLPDRHGKPSLRVQFPLPVCRACALHDQCTQTAAKVLMMNRPLPPSRKRANAKQRQHFGQCTPNEQALRALLRKLYAPVRCGERATVAAKSSGFRHASRLQPSICYGRAPG